MLLTLSRRSLAVALVALLLLIAPATAATAGQITIFGAASGSHLRLSTSGGNLVVESQMANRAPIGCGFTRGHDQAVCPLAGIGAVELQMGDSGDFVEVEDPLPAGVVAHLGGGSDKFIGDAEGDTCYSEGARRNRCIGGPGDDVCWTGEQNSDCVGGPGDDFCHTGAGSDGCWGGPGDDICVMGSGNDGCHGEAGDDRLLGGPGNDQLYGGEGVNYCDGLPGVGQSHGCNVGPEH